MDGVGVRVGEHGGWGKVVRVGEGAGVGRCGWVW